jgi:hypothetical protein
MCPQSGVATGTWTRIALRVCTYDPKAKHETCLHNLLGPVLKENMRTFVQEAGGTSRARWWITSFIRASSVNEMSQGNNGQTIF